MKRCAIASAAIPRAWCTQCLLKGLEVLRVGPLRPDASASTSAALPRLRTLQPQPSWRPGSRWRALDARELSARGSRSLADVHPRSPVCRNTVDVGLDRRLAITAALLKRLGSGPRTDARFRMARFARRGGRGVRLDGLGGSEAAFECLVLAATRSAKVRLATWQEIDLDTMVWTIPAARMTTAREHRDTAVQPSDSDPASGAAASRRPARRRTGGRGVSEPFVHPRGCGVCSSLSRQPYRSRRITLNGASSQCTVRFAALASLRPLLCGMHRVAVPSSVLTAPSVDPPVSESAFRMPVTARERWRPCDRAPLWFRPRTAARRGWSAMRDRRRVTHPRTVAFPFVPQHGELGWTTLRPSISVCFIAALVPARIGPAPLGQPRLGASYRVQSTVQRPRWLVGSSSSLSARSVRNPRHPRRRRRPVRRSPCHPPCLLLRNATDVTFVVNSRAEGQLSFFQALRVGAKITS